MCSLGNDNFGEESSILRKEKVNQKFNKCNKCKVEIPNVVLGNKGAYCKACFLLGTTHKFKAQLGKSKLIRPSDKVLVCHKIGHASTALLHFLRMGLDLNTPKKISFNPIIVFVDDLDQLNDEERTTVLKNVVTEIESFGFKPHFISFVEYINELGIIQDLISNKVTQRKSSNKITLEQKDNWISNTDKDDLKIIQMRKLLTDLAKAFDCKFVFTPEISIDISAQLLTNVSLGRGSHLSVDIGFCDNRDEFIKILRPLRSFDMKELAFYNKFNNLEPLSLQQSKNNPYSSVQHLMFKFLKGLQVDFPDTITTILKTGDKIGSNKSVELCCRLCKGFINPFQPQLCSEESTIFSRLVSTEKPNYSLSRQDRYKQVLDKFEQISSNGQLTCYSCSKLEGYIVLN